MTSPTAPPPSEPRPKRRSAAAGERRRLESEAEERQMSLPLTVAGLLPEYARRLQVAMFYLEELDAPPRSNWAQWPSYRARRSGRRRRRRRRQMCGYGLML